ncbi:MAG: TIGR02099 family protein [Sterolibacterium sp.]|nr:TIGR02099 family protein [Sterolibacterium sp.]
MTGSWGWAFFPVVSIGPACCAGIFAVFRQKIAAIKPADSSLFARRPRILGAWPGRRLSAHWQHWQRWLWWLALTLYFATGLLILILRHAVFPYIEDYRGNLEQALANALNLPVAIQLVDARWRGFSPHLALQGLQIRDEDGRPALTFDHVEADLSWTSLLHFELRLRRLEILAPQLDVRRDRAGRIFVAGLQLNTQAADSDNAFLEWLLAQHRIIIRDAGITWHDEQRGAPPLTLQHFNLHLQNDGRRHRFGLTAEPPQMLASRFDIRGDFSGRKLDQPATWKGRAYAELAYADLSVWRQWIDYPVDLPQGSGALRVWLNLEQQQLAGMMADIALRDVRVRASQELPFLDLQNLSGRLEGRRNAQGYQLSAQRLSLQTEDGIAFAPMDFQLAWNEATGRKPASGVFEADQLDFDVLVRFAAYLPFDAGLRKQLDNYAPRGRLSNLKTSWAGRLDEQGRIHPDKYSLSAHFERLGMNAWGALPGFAGLSGSVAGNEQGGTFRLASKAAILQLPAVFADPQIEFGSLNAELNWKTQKEAVELRLERASFNNADAAGSITGNYIYPRDESGTPGRIDLQARLTHGQGNAVWRYIPLVVDEEVRDWLRTSIIGGIGKDANLRLQGDLRNFPFEDGSGIFEIKGGIDGATLDYAEGWPKIDNIMGSLEFIGNRMVIRADSARIAGVKLNEVMAEIADLSADENLLRITGKASGPTSDFLDFIEHSPVGASIDHFTEDMKAQGNGFLDLKLLLPLQQLASAKIVGSYRFAGNRIDVDPDLPTLANVYGQLNFTGDALEAKRIRATLLGMPLAFDLKTMGNGVVKVDADGQLNILELRKQFSHPLLDHLSGSSPWRGTVLARKKNSEAVLESRLTGIASSLPEPFNKSASDVLPLRFERQPLVVAPVGKTTGKAATTVVQTLPRDQLSLVLGQVLKLQLVRRAATGAGSQASIERGLIGLGESPALPSRGVLLAINLPTLDVDRWRALLDKPASDKADEQSALASFPLSAVMLKTSELKVLEQTFNDFVMNAELGRDATWRAELKSPGISGELSKKNSPDSRLYARLKQLSLDSSAKTAVTSTRQTRQTTRPGDLPDMDVEIEQFNLRGRPFGKLKLTADNRNEGWDARFDIDNEDGRFVGSGSWSFGAAQGAGSTDLKFTLTARSIEKLLGRMGYADAVKRGKATLEGRLAWLGAPSAIEYASLNGELKVDAENGQFNKLEPGVGRLLGILSLQSLPRRISLDFRDVFSQGFAFDSINGQLTMRNGIMETQGAGVQIRGPAAKVQMTGSVNLPQETQNLKVRVQPAIGESLAVGAMIASPAAGAIAWLAQKALRDPLDQAFAFEYAVTGGWAEPKVERLSRPASFAPTNEGGQ